MKYFKQLSVYTFVSFLGAGIGFFLMPYLSHFITPDEYGILSIFNSFVTLIIPLVSLVASSIITVEYYKMPDKKEFASLFSSVQLIPLIPTAACLLLVLFFSSSLSRFLEVPDGKNYWLTLSLVIGFFTVYYETLFMYNVIDKKPMHYAFFNIAKLFVEVSLTIWFVSGLRMGWEGRMWSWFISNAVLALVSLFYFQKHGLLTTNVKAKYFWLGVTFGLPLILHTVGKFVINQSNRIFIAKLGSVYEAGIYNVGAQVGVILLLLVNAIGNFYQPFLYERLANLDELARKQIVQTCYIIVLGLLASLLLLTLFAPLFFTYLMDPKYSTGAVYVFWVGLGYFFWGIYILFSGFIFYERKTRFLGYLAVLNVAVSTGLNYILISKFGPIGAAYSSVVSYFLVALIIIWKVSAMFTLPWFSFFKKAGA